MPVFRLPENFLILKYHCMKKYYSLIALFALTACGYKGDLYLPKPDDKNQFGVIQTGLELTPPVAASQPKPLEKP